MSQAEQPPNQAKLLEAMAKALGLAARQAEQGAQLEQLLELCSRQSAAIAHLGAPSRALSARRPALRASTAAVRESTDRTPIVARSPGLEGSRMPEPEGRALLTVGEELRNTAGQAEGALDELMALLSQVDSDRQA